ncbi:MAG: hypothetical protein H0V05_20470 [Euzebyaceae bacterium]|nr:hypothetical protein [Euzebyaceae bacterium]
MTITVVLGLLSAVANAAASLLSKQLTRRLPARQLIGPLLALNALLVAPAAPFVAWTWTPPVVALHVASAALLVVTSLAVWDLFDHGEASAVVAAMSISPLPTTVAVAAVLPGVLRAPQVIAAVVVVGAVLYALSGAFAALSRRRTLATVLVVATGTGLITVLGRLLADRGAGVVEAYLVRTGLAAAASLLLVPPRDVPVRELPSLAVRAALVTTHFLLILVAVQEGSPAVVQTAVATAPLLVLAAETARSRRAPPRRLLLAAVAASAGVAVVLL